MTTSLLFRELGLNYCGLANQPGSSELGKNKFFQINDPHFILISINYLFNYPAYRACKLLECPFHLLQIHIWLYRSHREVYKAMDCSREEAVNFVPLNSNGKRPWRAIQKNTDTGNYPWFAHLKPIKSVIDLELTERLKIISSQSQTHKDWDLTGLVDLKRLTNLTWTHGV